MLFFPLVLLENPISFIGACLQQCRFYKIKYVVCPILYNMQEADALLGTFGGIENKFDSCWLISAIQLLNSTSLHTFLSGELVSLYLMLATSHIFL